jgi:glycosyltransferase involved in cell wall biosynthesis
MARLSVLIPSRNEPYLKPTIDDVLKNSREDTEVIAVCDGAWPVEGIPDHPRVHLVYVPTAIGQRAATNLAARLSTADYVMKLDAHCSLSEGFDTALLAGAAALGDDVTQIPVQYHLHVFNRRCRACNHEEHHGPLTCRNCGSTDVETLWFWERRQSRPRLSTEAPRGGYVQSTSWGFDAQPKFQYFGEFQNRPEGRTRPYSDTMSCLGACFFLSRERYWQLGGFDESYGVWGSFGIELACKSWLSGGRMVVNHDAWFSHWFRTQGGGEMSFPYDLTAAQQHAAMLRAKEIWFNNDWPGQVRPLSWLIDHFSPVPNWPVEQQEERAS